MSMESLAVLILQIIQVPPALGEHVVMVLHHGLLTAPLTLLLLDNFEFIWDSDSTWKEGLDLLHDAKSPFLTINPSPTNSDDVDGHYLDMLLAEMDFVPLAVRLLVQVCIGFSPLYMLNQWR
jgi:hypothetical protein